MRDKRPHLSCRVEAGTDLDLLRLLGHPLDDPVEYPVFHKEPGSRATTLAVVEEDGARRSSNCHIEVRILENDVRRLPAKLERYLLEIPCGSGQDELADRR